MTTRKAVVLCILLVLVAGCSLISKGTPTASEPSRLEAEPSPQTGGEQTERLASPTAPSAEPESVPDAGALDMGDLQDLISRESLFAYLEALVAIQPYSGWRNSASTGEEEAVSLVADELASFGYLEAIGLHLEQESFRVFLATELRQTRLYLTVEGQVVEVPADGLRGPRDDIGQALRFDSDGSLNDAAENPIDVESEVAVVLSSEQVETLDPAHVTGRVVLLNYAAVDRTVLGTQGAVNVAENLLSMHPAGLVLITSFSNEIGESHGAFVGDVSAINRVEVDHVPPVLYARLEDLEPAGIKDWGDLDRVSAARLEWDADVFAPGNSSNLVARVPGEDSTRAVILGAHIDSPNSPGAMDDGSGSVALLEVARVLNEGEVKPPVDLYLVWFGSEELGLVGSAHFVTTHQELLDRAIAMLEIDCLTRPLNGIDAELSLVTWSYGRLGDARLLWPTFLADAAADEGLTVQTDDIYSVYSDNSAFAGFDVPHADLIYVNELAMAEAGGVHYAGHLHDPYDTVALTREVGDQLEAMARIALAAALEPGREDSSFRVAPQPSRRALFVATHTEAVHMAPTFFTDLGMALAWEGYDVDMIPYGTELGSGDLDGVDLVVALPVLDYPSPGGDVTVYDEAWTQEEVSLLEQYVLEGGTLVIANSAHRLKYHNRMLDPNEDWEDVDALAGRFGVDFQPGTFSAGKAERVADHTLTDGVRMLRSIEGNAVPFTIESGLILASAGDQPVAALVTGGDHPGSVLVLADVGLLGASDEPHNLRFWQNLARFAGSH